MTNHAIPVIVLGLLVVIVGATILWRLARRYRRQLGLDRSDREKTPDVSFIINAFQDVTRQLKEKEKELERLRMLAEQRADNVESYTQNILQCVTSGVITFDRNGLSTTANRAAEEILRSSDNGIIGHTCAEIFGENEICRLTSDSLVNEHPSHRMETSFLRGDERIWIGFNTALLTDRHGKCLGVILSFSDLTEVKQLQEQIELRERLTALGEMSAGIAHELRNPMAVIAGYLNLLAKKQDEPGQAIIRDVLAEISGMNRIIGDLLTFARPAALNRTSVNLREMVESCLAGARQATGNEKVRVDIADGDMNARVDETLMRQAIGNLLQNAMEAMPEGGVLSVSMRDVRDLTIAITDTGAGISPEQIKKIFLPFFTTKDTGVGMGLALTHKIITTHGGRIEVESSPGQGTTFTVILPKG